MRQEALDSPWLARALILGSGNTMANIIVWVSKGLPAGKTYPAPTTPVTLDQIGCQYVPHAQGIMVGQPYKILNSDGILHNVHSLPKVNRQFNKPMPPSLKETTTTFDKPEPVFQIKCDVHPWMTAGFPPASYQTFILLANPGATAATVALTFLRTDGTTLQRTVAVPGIEPLHVGCGRPTECSAGTRRRDVRYHRGFEPADRGRARHVRQPWGSGFR